jgi:SOS-response transcriptional repressor LexA
MNECSMKATISLDPQKQLLTEKQRDVLHFLQEYYERSGFPPTMKEIGDRFGFASTNAVTQYLQALERKGYIRRLTKGASRGIQLIDFTPTPKRPFTQKNNGNSAADPNSNANRNTSAFQPLQGVFQTMMQGVKNIIIAGEASASRPLAAFLSPRGQLKIDTDFFAPSTHDQQGLETHTGQSQSVKAQEVQAQGVQVQSGHGQGVPVQLFAAIVEDEGMSADAIRQGDVVVAQQQFTAQDGALVVVIVHDAIVVRRLSLVGTVGELTASTRGFPPVSLNTFPPNAAIIGVVCGAMRKL